MTIAENRQRILTEIRQAETLYQRSPKTVQLLAVSKGQTAAAIYAAYQSGQTVFGENYLQEALLKMAALAAYPLEWHFIGPIQRNKTKKIAEHFDWVHSVSDVLIAERLNSQRPIELKPLQILLQVNVSEESTKVGINAEKLLELVEACQQMPRLELRGLMCIPAEKKIFLEQRAEYRKLLLLFQKLCKKNPKLDTLSMGMSNDLAAAIAEGSTMVRIGTKIFGDRK